MKFHRAISSITSTFFLALACVNAHAVTQNKQAKSQHSKKAHVRRGAWKRHGQQHIDEQRTREIQAALIREKYLDGESSGEWDQQTKDAMTKYQADHGWQTKSLPDARALISLGLGPKADGPTLPPQTVPTSSFTTPAQNSTVPLELVQRQ